MSGNFLTKIIGSKNDREIKKLRPLVDEINEVYDQLQGLSEEELKAQTEKFKKLIQDRTKDVTEKIKSLRQELEESYKNPENTIEDRDEIRDQIAELEDEEKRIIDEVMDEILPEAFATVKEVCHRFTEEKRSWNVVDHKMVWDMIPFDVQLMGAIALHQGKIAEMATGEGKTLVATMPLYLNALTGKGAHLVTVNDYLARRDAEWMGEIFKYLGLSVAYITNDMDTDQRKRAYSADITYGTNNEFGFDYLRDNMAISVDDMVQRGHYYAIVDEVDSVLIDEARTPLIISGPVGYSNQQYKEMKPMVERLVRSQTILVNQFISEAEKLLKEDKEYEAGIRLLQASRGAPKNKRLIKLLHEPGLQKLVRRVENDYIRDKRLHEVDDDLYYSIDEKSNTIDLTDKGREKLAPNNQDMFIIPDIDEETEKIEADESFSKSEKERKKEKLITEYAEKNEKLHNIQQLLKAYSLFEKDVEYVVSDGKVMIVDEFTGRLMPGRRYSDGLHQALEAKENVKVEGETQTLATITLQNYFRMYYKLAGMTGTAATEANEFWEIYKLDVIVIPTNRPVRRIDYQDQIYRTRREKYNAVIEEVVRHHEAGRPVLVGTVSVDVSETLSRMLKRRGIKHSVLNAKYHQQEAEIISRAGEPGAVTIATNMAGRGTDIKLGKGVVRCSECFLVDRENQAPDDIDINACKADMPCGLHIIGTERHESRRIDLQLRGRAGRQGDPGSSKFYLSLEDDLMRLFGSERIAGVMDKLGLKEGEVITHSMITKSIERAQKRVEAQNFGIRKHLLEYDDVMNQQREVIYDRRNHALREENLKDEIVDMIDEFVTNVVEEYTESSTYSEEWDWDGMRAEIMRVMMINLPFKESEISELSKEEVIERIREKAMQAYEYRERKFGSEMMREIERVATLRVIDEQWKEHLYEMDLLKEGIGLRAYGQKDPLIEYKKEGFRMFTEMLERISEGVLQFVFRAQPQIIPQIEPRPRPQQISTIHESSTGMGYRGVPEAVAEEEVAARRQGGRDPSQPKQKPIRVVPKVGRNDPCPCGSGLKYKYCHGRKK